ncbi:MAG: ubiquinone biosynthesis protein [Saprospiraceae bacterium]|jgi:ubiquinone biosynthesis protein
MQNIGHLLRIARVTKKYQLDEFFANTSFYRKFTWIIRCIPASRKFAKEPRGLRLRLALQELGPVFIKFGQTLSTRPDLIAPDVAIELVKLQDQVPPFSGEQARQLVEAAYDDTLDDHLASFNDEPLAAASVAQVHEATLHDGKEVIVKVIRPDIRPVIDRDIALLYRIATLLDTHWKEAKRLNLIEVVQDYDNTIHDELDLMREAANASQLRVNFEGSPLIYVPSVYWDHCRESVMVMEKIDGIPIRDTDEIVAAGIDLVDLSNKGVEIFFTQAFRDGFFHADMHPGNIFVGLNGQYRAVDFGIMGSLSDGDKRYLAENFLAFFNRDYRAVADAHIRAGWVPSDTRATDFEAAIRTVCEPIFARPIKDISFGRFLMSLFKTARRFNMPVQPQLVLLQKTLLNIEGLGRSLNPDLDLWDTAKPFLERWMSDQIGPKAAIRTLKQELPKLFTLAPEIPALSHELLRRMRDENLTVKTQSAQISQLSEAMANSSARQNTLILTGLLLFVSVLAANSGFVQAALLSYAVQTLAALAFTIGWYRSR